MYWFNYAGILRGRYFCNRRLLISTHGRCRKSSLATGTTGTAVLDRNKLFEPRIGARANALHILYVINLRK
jgi:hypothetical protein